MSLDEHLGDVLVAVEDLEDVLLELRVAELVVQHVLELPAEGEGAPAEVGLEDLTDVHAARNAERVEHDVDRATVLQCTACPLPEGCGEMTPLLP